MRARLVSLVVAVSGLLVACSSSPYGETAPPPGTPTTAENETTSTSPTDPTLPPPAKPPPPPPLGKDAGSSSDGDAAATDPAGCPSKAPPTVGAWKPPPAASSVCSAADMTYFAQVAANQTWLGIESLMQMRNANCAKCIFSKETDLLWRPVIFVGAEGDAIVNYGACFARAAGGSNACGRGVHEWGDCYANVCDATACGTDPAIDACYATQTVADACDAYNPIQTCGGDAPYASLNNICGTYIEVARTLCAAGN